MRRSCGLSLTRTSATAETSGFSSSSFTLSFLCPATKFTAPDPPITVFRRFSGPISHSPSSSSVPVRSMMTGMAGHQEGVPTESDWGHDATEGVTSFTSRNGQSERHTAPVPRHTYTVRCLLSASWPSNGSEICERDIDEWERWFDVDPHKVSPVSTGEEVWRWLDPLKSQEPGRGVFLVCGRHTHRQSFLTSQF